MFFDLVIYGTVMQKKDHRAIQYFLQINNRQLSRAPEVAIYREKKPNHQTDTSIGKTPRTTYY